MEVQLGFMMLRNLSSSQQSQSKHSSQTSKLLERQQQQQKKQHHPCSSSSIHAHSPAFALDGSASLHKGLHASPADTTRAACKCPCSPRRWHLPLPFLHSKQPTLPVGTAVGVLSSTAAAPCSGASALIRSRLLSAALAAAVFPAGSTSRGFFAAAEQLHR